MLWRSVLEPMRGLHAGTSVAYLPRDGLARGMKKSGRLASLRPAGLLIHRLLIERPIFLLAMSVGVTTNLIWSDWSKSEAGRPRILALGVGSTAIV